MKIFGIICLLLTTLVYLTNGLYVSLRGGARGELSLEVKLDTTETLECDITFESGGTNAEIEWYYQPDKNLDSDGSFVVHENSLVPKFEGIYQFIQPANLRILNTKKTDSGRYKCRASSIAELNANDYGVYDVTIVYKPSVPMCSYPSDRVLTRGFEQELKCVSVEGVPDPVYTWYKDGKLLPSESSSDPNYRNASFSYDRTIGTLRFMEVNDANAGSYYCNSSNSQGWEQCTTFKLSIQDQNVGKIVGIVFGVIIAVGIVCLIIFVLWKKGYLTGGSDKEDEYMYDMAEEGNNDVMLDGEGPHVTKAPSDVGSVRPESSMMI